MKLFKSIDEKFEALGFKKIEESPVIVVYHRPERGYVHELALCHKINGKHLIQSYQKGVNTDGFNNMVGLTPEEAKLACKKITQKGWEFND